MEQTLQALSGILLKAIPTIILLVFLHQFFKAVLFKPVEKMLKQRHDLTDGARKAAAHSLKNAETKTAEYEAKLRDARAEVYKEQEATRKTWLDDQTAQIAQARHSAEASVRTAKEGLAAEVTAARATLAQDSEALADRIATALLARRVG
jgi:F-type H+-transporting ATPase subunit b